MNKEQQELNLVKHNIGTLNNDSNYEKIDNLQTYLNSEMDGTYCKPWTKLNKMQKMEKLHEYAASYKNKNDIDEHLMEELKLYLRKALDQKKLGKRSDIEYDEETGIIKNIPNLTYHKSSPRSKAGRFTLKSSSGGKSSTLKNLGIVKKKRKPKLKIDSNKELER